MRSWRRLSSPSWVIGGLHKRDSRLQVFHQFSERSRTTLLVFRPLAVAAPRAPGED
jgi:hypothetical protein